MNTEKLKQSDEELICQMNNLFDLTLDSLNGNLNSEYISTTEDVEFLRRSSKLDEIGIRAYVAMNPNTPKDILDDVLSKDKNRNVRGAVAMNQKTSISTLIELYNNDKTIETKRSLASNSNTPKEILTELSKSNDLKTRQYVAYNENTPINVLESLANDENKYIKLNIIDNKNSNLAILERLFLDDNINLSIYASKKLAEYTKIDSNTSADKLNELSKTIYDNLLKETIAKHPNTSKETLESLSKDDSYWVRQKVVYNENTPIDVIERLSQDKHEAVRYAVIDNPNISKEIVENLSQDKNLQVSSKALDRLSKLSKDDDYDVFSTKDKKQQKSTIEDELSSTNKHKR